MACTIPKQWRIYIYIYAKFTSENFTTKRNVFKKKFHTARHHVNFAGLRQHVHMVKSYCLSYCLYFEILRHSIV